MYQGEGALGYAIKLSLTTDPSIAMAQPQHQPQDHGDAPGKQFLYLPHRIYHGWAGYQDSEFNPYPIHSPRPPGSLLLRNYQIHDCPDIPDQTVLRPLSLSPHSTGKKGFTIPAPRLRNLTYRHQLDTIMVSPSLGENLRAYADPNPPERRQAGVVPQNDSMRAFYQQVFGHAYDPQAQHSGLTTAGPNAHPYPCARKQWTAICNLISLSEIELRRGASDGAELVESEPGIQGQTLLQILNLLRELHRVRHTDSFPDDAAHRY